ncbi:hypothetical protein H4R99_007047 [Coemansia sp. RSA 1722]|nr:hypothetical protein IWW45_006679 [Coemansia sp. RSA 485]KAJ2590588.1 hypothetical protein H4R99_007047 [Coemansia sp. RSA 1722]
MSPDQTLGASSAVYNDVTRANIEPLFPSIKERISKARFIAIDTEFTGLVLSDPTSVLKFNTAEWVTRAIDMETKYKAMCNVVRTHALVSMGISTYSRRHMRPGSYNVNNFNFTLQQQNSHLVNSASLGFLAENGYDLNKQAVSGIRYFSGPNPKPPLVRTKEINEEGWMIRQLFLEIVRTRVPLVVHNGLYDLLYIYQSFFGPLPDTYTSFVHDLSEMFPGGIYDTKYIVEMNEPESASFLAYLYHKHERKQKQRLEDDEPAVCIRIKGCIKYKPNVTGNKLEWLNKANDSGSDLPFCEQFAAHGHCRYKNRCSKSHDINLILDCQSKMELDSSSSSGNRVGKSNNSNGNNSNSNANNKDKAKNNKRKRDDDLDELRKSLDAGIARITEPRPEESDSSTIDLPEASNADVADDNSLGNMYHTAAYDAFMTGFIFASYRILLDKNIAEFKNKVFLMGKPDQPLLIKPGRYSTFSMTYRQTESMFESRADPDTIAAAAASADKQDDDQLEAPSSKRAAVESNGNHQTDHAQDDKCTDDTADTEGEYSKPVTDNVQENAGASTSAT